MLIGFFNILVLTLAGTALGMVLGDWIHERKTGKRIRDCGKRED